jgi:hypothetical protein
MSNIKTVGAYCYSPEDILGEGSFGNHYLAHKIDNKSSGP